MIDNLDYCSGMASVGRPTRFEPEMCELAHNYCLLGATNDDLAEFLGVSPATIDRWIADRADFGDAVRRGRIVADGRVARGLFARAVGYDRQHERQVMVGGELKPVTTTVHYPPNVQACIFWLRNHRPRNWGSRPEDFGDPPYDPIAELDAAGERARAKLRRAAGHEG
jgi:hypothetical protein